MAMGKTVLKIPKGGWRPTRQAVEAMVEAIKDSGTSQRCMVVLMGLDNGSCYEEDEEGTSVSRGGEAGHTFYCTLHRFWLGLLVWLQSS